ncbi:MAG: OmpA family protein [Treponema sp.]|jgi:outer membrane protein OmpA-like peptidoglycan-associated protein|nr:OmpA family protein [Treponema sp.]
MHFTRADWGEKAVLPFLTLFFVTFSVFPQQKHSFALGLFPEANANTRQGYGLAGGIAADYGITGRIAVGLKTDFGSDFHDVSSFEALAFGRYYFFNASPSFSLFAQAGAGLVMLFEGDRMVPSVLGDGALGIRFPVKNFYTEQYIRFGWPTGFGFGLAVGYRFGLKPPPLPKPLPEPVTPPVEQAPEVSFPGEPEQAPAEPPPPELIPEIPAVVPEGIEIVFPPYTAHFTDGGSWWQPVYNRNMEALAIIAGFLKNHPEYTVHVTGYANPVLGTDEEYRETLLPLSLERAVFIRDELVRLGVDAGCVTVSGAGSAEVDPENPQKNRRVELRFGKRDRS